MYTCVRHITYRERERERERGMGRRERKCLNQAAAKQENRKRKCFNPLTEVCYTNSSSCWIAIVAIQRTTIHYDCTYAIQRYAIHHNAWSMKNNGVPMTICLIWVDSMSRMYSLYTAGLLHTGNFTVIVYWYHINDTPTTSLYFMSITHFSL